MAKLKNLKVEQIIELATQLHQLIQLKEEVTRGNIKVDTKQMVANYRKSNPKDFNKYLQRLIQMHGYDENNLDVKKIKKKALMQRTLIKEQYKIFRICNENDIDFQKIMTTDGALLNSVKDYLWNCKHRDQLRELKWQMSKSKLNDKKFPACVNKVVKDRIEILKDYIDRFEKDPNLTKIDSMIYGGRGSQNFEIVYNAKNHSLLKMWLIRK